MKIAIEQATLSEALTWVASVVPKRPTHPILGGLHLKADDIGLSLRATDLESSHIATASAVVGEPGEAYVPGHMLRDLIGSMSSRSTVELDTDADGRELTIRQARTRIRLGVMVADDAPGLPQPLDVTELIGSTEVGALRGAIASVLHPIDDSTAGDDLRGIRIEAADGHLYVVGASRHAIAVRSVPWLGEPFAIQAPHQALANALRGFAADTDVDLFHSPGEEGGGLLGLSGCAAPAGSDEDHERGAGYATTRLYAGKPMPWRKLIRPISEDTQNVIVGASELAGALRRAAFLARDEPTAELSHDTTDPDWLSIHAIGRTHHGTGEDVIAVSNDSGATFAPNAQPIRVGINPAWMAEAIEAIAAAQGLRDPEIRIGFDATKALGPLTIRAIGPAPDARELVTVITPRRLA